MSATNDQINSKLKLSPAANHAARPDLALITGKLSDAVRKRIDQALDANYPKLANH